MAKQWHDDVFFGLHFDIHANETDRDLGKYADRAELLEQFHGISIQDEKEVLLIACAKSARNAIMDAINAEHGLKTEQQSVVCSLPIDRLVRLT